MSNPFENRAPTLSGPSRDIEPVSPSDTVNLPSVALALFVETAGSVTFVTVKGPTRTVNVANFSILPTGVLRVMATGTTATGIHAFTV